MRTAIVCGALMLTITSVDAQTRPVDKALNAWANCSTDAIMRLDDGRSDAASVARAVIAECRMKREILLYQMAADMLKDHTPGREA
jgi:hypothetical protein